MKKTLFPALAAVALLLAPAGQAWAQMVVNDPLHMGVQIGEFAKRLQQWSSTVQNYQVVKDARQIAGVTKDITSEVRSLTQEGSTCRSRCRLICGRCRAFRTCGSPTRRSCLRGPWPCPAAARPTR